MGLSFRNQEKKRFICNLVVYPVAQESAALDGEKWALIALAETFYDGRMRGLTLVDFENLRRAA